MITIIVFKIDISISTYSLEFSFNVANGKSLFISVQLISTNEYSFNRTNWRDISDFRRHLRKIDRDEQAIHRCAKFIV